MRWISGVVGGLNAPRLSRWLLATAMALLVGWLQAHILLAAVHDDGTTVRNAIAVYNDEEVRDQVGGAVGWAFDQGRELSGATELDTVQAALSAMLESGQLSPAVADALLEALLAVRDDALAQFADDGPTHALAIPLGPLIAALGVTVPDDMRQALGLPDGEIVMPVVAAEGMDTLRTRYRWAALLDSWGLLAAGILAAAGVILSLRPLRTLAITLGLGGVACLVALPLFAVIQDWLVGGGVGAWSPLLAPLVDGAIGEVRPWLLPIGITSVVIGAGSLVALVVLERRTGKSPVSEPASA